MSDSKMDKINRFTRRKFTEDEVYCFSVILCDNEIDRDGEKFSVSALKKLAELYVGKTGIWSHDPKGENQTARIYEAETVSDPTKKTADGEEYTYLKASAYMVRTDSNADLIKEIEGGIKKEVSVGCAVAKRSCSVCGADRSVGCTHRKGRSYNGRRCFDILDEPSDAYEWSFVAVPAQKGAGVTKRFSAEEKTYCPTDSVAEELLEDLRRDIIRLSFISGDSVPASLTKAAIMKMEPQELLQMKRALAAVYRPEPRTGELEKALSDSKKQSKSENSSFRI